MPTRQSVVVGLVLTVQAPAAHADVLPPADSIPFRPPKPPVSRTSPLPEIVEVWVDLTLPPTAHVPPAERAAAYRRIVEQQNETMARLAQLGAVELARVQHARNAIAVRIPSAALDQARAIDGVKAVRIVRHLQRNTS